MTVFILTRSPPQHAVHSTTIHVVVYVTCEWRRRPAKVFVWEAGLITHWKWQRLQIVLDVCVIFFTFLPIIIIILSPAHRDLC